MKKRLFYFLFAWLFVFCSFAQPNRVFEYSDSTFEVGSIHLLPLTYCYNGTGGLERCGDSNILIIENASMFIKNHPNFRFRIECHTDSRGSSSYNQALSEGRAKAMERVLVKKYLIDSTRVKSIGYGETQPIISDQYLVQMKVEHECDLEALFAANRRILLRIIEINE